MQLEKLENVNTQRVPTRCNPTHHDGGRVYSGGTEQQRQSESEEWGLCFSLRELKENLVARIKRPTFNHPPDIIFLKAEDMAEEKQRRRTEKGGGLLLHCLLATEKRPPF